MAWANEILIDNFMDSDRLGVWSINQATEGKNEDFW